MTNITAFIGEPLNFKDKIWIYPPKIKDVVTNHKFGIYSKILTITQEEIIDELRQAGKSMSVYPTPFEFLLGNCYSSNEFRQLTIEAFEYFCRTKITFLFEEKKVVIGELEKIIQEISDITQNIYLLEEEYKEEVGEI